MTSRERLSATVERHLLDAGRYAVAEGRADSLSAWVNDALARQAEHDRRLKALRQFIQGYEREHGVITDDEILTILEREANAGQIPITHGGIVGQVWRGGLRRQARLARALPGIAVRAIDDALGREAGVLLGRARTSDVIDAALVLIAEDGDEIFTADEDDLRHLANVAGKVIDLVRI